MNIRKTSGAIAAAGYVILNLILPLQPIQAAAAGINLEISPLVVDLSASPGSTVTSDLRVRNNGASTEHLKTSLMKFKAEGDNGTPVLLDRQSGDDYFDWVSFSPSSFDAPTGVWQNIKMTVNLPKTAAFGYYYAVVFSRASAEPVKKGAANISGSTATLILLDAKVPNAKRSLQLDNFKANHSTYEFLPVKLSYKLHNDGNVHLRPFGNIIITKDGKQVATIDANSSSGNILPQSNRIYEATWKDGFPSYGPKMINGVGVTEKGKAVQELKWDPTKFGQLRFGRYTAKLVMAYDDGKTDVPLEATLSFWVIPWRIIGATLLLLLVFGSGMYFMFGRGVVGGLRRLSKRRK